MTRLGVFVLGFLVASSAHAAEVPAPTKSVYRIAGVAVNSRNGSPIPFCRIFLVPAGNQREGQRAGGNRGGGFGNAVRLQDADTQADAHGHFQLELPQAGAWRLQGEARGFRRQSLEAHDGFSAQVIVSPAAPVAAVTLRLDADSTLSGAVLDEAGDPVAQASVQAEAVFPADSGPRRPTQRAQAFSQTDDRGHFELSGLAPGDYRLRVQARPWYAIQSGTRSTQTGAASLDPSLDMVYPTTWYPAATDPEHAETLTLAGGESRQADLHLQPMPAAHLLVPRTDPPETAATGDSRPLTPRGPGYQLRRVASEAEIGFAGFSNASITGSAGDWDFGGLQPGLYTLEKRTQDGDADGGALQIRVPTGGGPVDLAAAVPLVPLRIVFDFAAAEQDSGVTVTLTDQQDGARYSTGQNGAFGGRERRRGRSGGGPMQNEAANPDNTVTLQVPPHSFLVSVIGGGSAYVTGMQASGAQLQQSAAAAGQMPAGPVLSVPDTGAGKQPPTLTLELADGRAEIYGQSTLAGKALEGAMVLAVPALLGQPGNFAEVRRAETNTDGSFTLAAMTPGAYIVVVLDHGWNVNWRDEATLTRYLAQGVPVDLKPGATIKLVVPAVEP